MYIKIDLLCFLKKNSPLLWSNYHTICIVHVKWMKGRFFSGSRVPSSSLRVFRKLTGIGFSVSLRWPNYENRGFSFSEIIPNNIRNWRLLKPSNTRLCRVSYCSPSSCPPPTAIKVFFYQFCDVAKMVIIYIKEDLAKYGYKLDMEIKNIISIFL
jgi:hypothetical protein